MAEWRKTLAVAALAAFTFGAAALQAAPGSSGSPERIGSAGANDTRSEKQRGLVYDGLTREANGPCGHSYRLRTAGSVMCTHGPDPAPAGIDVTKERTTQDLVAAGVNGTPNHTGSVQCIGDGVGGA